MPTIQDYYNNQYQYTLGDYTTSTPEGDQQAVNYHPGYIPELLALRNRVRSGQATPWDREWYGMQEAAARSIPMRNVAGLTYNAGEDATDRLSGGSPDLAHIMLTLLEKLEQGRATPQEQDLFQTTYRMLMDQNWRASVPQASDAFNPLGDNLMGALSMLAIGASGGAAAGPIAAGEALTLGSVAGLAGAAGGVTGMMGEALDEDMLRKAGIAMGAAGGLAGAGNLLSQGLNSAGDVMNFLNKTYSGASKAYNLAQGAGSTPDQAGLPRGANDSTILSSRDPAARAGTVSSRSQSSTAASSGGRSMDTNYTGDTRRDFIRGGGNTGSSGGGSGGGGGSMDFNTLGGTLVGLVGLAGAGLSLADVARYMGQLKDQYGEQQEIKDLIDQAYELAKNRYETYYNQTQRQDDQSQEAYRTSVERADQYYEQTQGEQAQRGEAYQEQRRQIAEDRQRQQQSYLEDRQRVLQTFDRRQQELEAELAQQKAIYGENRARQVTNFDQRQQQLLQNRQKELQTFDQDYARKLQRDDLQLQEIAQERGMGMQGWQASYDIGKNLSDPNAIKAGAQQIYRPLSDLAVQRVSDEVGVDRSLRGLSGPGQYGDYLAAKAYAPFENQLWETALNTYLGGQRTALDAYGNRTLARSGNYSMTTVPQFTTGENWNSMDIPNFTDLPQFAYGQRPVFEQQNAGNVPQTVRYTPQQAPGVPNAKNPDAAPAVDPYTAKPYAPFGTTRETGQGLLGGGAGGLQQLVGNLVRLFPQLFGDSSTRWLAGAASSDTSALGDSSSLAARAVAGLLGSGGGDSASGGDYYGPYVTDTGMMDWNAYNTDLYQNLGDIDYSLY